MDKLRIGVFGLVWFREIRCETNIGVPALRLSSAGGGATTVAGMVVFHAL